MKQISLLVVLPTLGDRLEFLKKALTSCADLRDYISVTIVMVVPRSAEAARNLGREFGAQILDDPGKGMSAAINAAIRHRTTEDFYVWVGDDDELLAPGISRLLDVIKRDERVVVAYGNCQYVDTFGNSLGVSRAGILATWLMTWGPNLLPHPGTVVRLDTMQNVGGFDEKLSYAMDLDMFLRLRRVGKFVHLPVLTSRFGWHSASATVANRSLSFKESILVKKRYLRPLLRLVSWIWDYPVLIATRLASWLINGRGSRRSS